MEGLVKAALDPIFTSNDGQLHNNPAYRFGRGLRTKVLPATLGPIARSLKPMQTSFGTMPGWANGLMVGGLGGAALGGLAGMLTGRGAVRGALMGGLAGGAGLGAAGYALSGKDWLKNVPLLGGFAGHLDSYVTDDDQPVDAKGRPISPQNYRTIENYFKKESSAWGTVGSDKTYILQKIFMDSAMAAAEKQQLANGVERLSDAQAARLKQMISAGFGAAAGAIVAKYLAGLGIAGTLVASVLGGALGGAMGRTPKKNTHDSLGRAYFF